MSWNIKFFKWAYFITAYVLFTTHCYASDTGTTSSFFDLQLFSLSKQTESAFDAAAAVHIITSEDIRRSGVTTIPDALRMVPGVQVAQQGAHKWAAGVRGFNFQFTNKLLVLVDGRIVYKPLFSGTLWDSVDVLLEDIERIEVIRGPGGAIWGNNAVNGVINVITKHAGSSQGTYVSLTTSTNDDGIIDIRHGGKLENGYYRISAKNALRGDAYTLDGQDANDEWESSLFNYRADWDIDNKNSFSLQTEFREGTANNYFSVFPTLTAPFNLIEPRLKNEREIYLMGKWEHTLNKNAYTQSQFYFDYDRKRTGIVDWDAYIFDGDFQYFTNVNQNHKLVLGLGIRHTSDLQRNPGNQYLNYRNRHRYDTVYNAFFQDRIALIKDSLYVTIGSKFEHNEFSGFEYQPSIRAVLYPQDNQTMWASVSRAARVPSRGESDAIVRVAGTPAGFIGRKYSETEPLQSEELMSYEMGYRIRPIDTLSFEAAAFYNDYNTLRTLEAAAPFDDLILPLEVQYEGFGETYGVELNGKWQVNKNFKMQASYSFLKMALHRTDESTDVNFESIERQSPQQKFSFHSFYNFSPEIEIDGNLYFVDKLSSTSSAVIDSYVSVGARIGWHPTNNLEISLSGSNLLDDRHQEFQNSLYSPSTEIGRNLLLKVALSL